MSDVAAELGATHAARLRERAGMVLQEPPVSPSPRRPGHQLGHLQRRIRGPVTYASFLPIAIISGVFDPTFGGLPGWLSRVVDLGLWTIAGATFTLWRFRSHH